MLWPRWWREAVRRRGPRVVAVLRRSGPIAMVVGVADVPAVLAAGRGRASTATRRSTRVRRPRSPATDAAQHVPGVPGPPGAVPDAGGAGPVRPPTQRLGLPLGAGGDRRRHGRGDVPARAPGSTTAGSVWSPRCCWRVMPYHVVVSRQVLLDGLMTLCATVVLYCVVRYAESAGAVLVAGGRCHDGPDRPVQGDQRRPARWPVRVLRAHPDGPGPAAPPRCWPCWRSVGDRRPDARRARSGRPRRSTGRNYLLWQVFRRGNHGMLFYVDVLPVAIGPLVLVAAVAGLVWLRRENTWRERLLMCWIVGADRVLHAVAGQGIPVPAADRAGRWPCSPGGRWPRCSTIAVGCAGRAWLPRAHRVVAAVLVTALSLAVPAWARVNPAPDGTFLAGTGGLPGGREAGRVDPGQRAGARPAAGHRAVDGQRAGVLRPPPGPRAVGQPQPERPQPGLRTGAQPRSFAARRGVPVHRLGLVHGQPRPRSSPTRP